MRDDVGCVEATAKADLQNARIGRRLREGEECRGGCNLEEARFDSRPGIDHFGKCLRELLVLDQPAGDTDPLVEADEVGTGKRVDAVAACFQRRAEERDGRSLSVGAGDVKDRWKRVLRTTKAVEQFGN